MIEQNPVHREHPIRLPVLLRDPESILLGHRIRTVGVEGCGFLLGNLFDLAIQFRSGCLIHLRFLRKSQDSNCLQDPQNTQCIHIAGILGHIKGYLYMALCRQVIDLIRLHQADNSNHRRGIRQISIMQRHCILLYQMIDPRRIGNGGSAGNAVNLISLLQQKLCQVRSILSGNACDQCFFHGIALSFIKSCFDRFPL